MENTDYPLISCICITQAGPKLLQRSISCFLGQTYPNRELVIVYDSNDTTTKKACDLNKHPNVIFYGLKKSSEISLGDLRNYALEKSKGDYICFWADGDWHHVARLEYQYEALTITGFSACILYYILIFDNTTDKTYISRKRLWEESMLCKKIILKNSFGEGYSLAGDLTDLLENFEREKNYT